jgi:hydroxymethylpyrimidine/phosphomethylpyrimidine kinase
MKKVLSIAGSDCSGGAGIQADLKTFSAHGVYGMSVIVSVVAENTSRVIDIQDITPDIIEKQIDAVFEDIEVDAVKIGMLSTEASMKTVAKKLEQYKPKNVVIDPVMYAKNGCPLMNPSSIDTLIKEVLPYADVLTPNIPEAEKISNIRISKVEDMKAAAQLIYNMGCRNVLVKGGHALGAALDILYD